MKNDGGNGKDTSQWSRDSQRSTRLRASSAIYPRRPSQSQRWDNNREKGAYCARGICQCLQALFGCWFDMLPLVILIVVASAELMRRSA